MNPDKFREMLFWVSIVFGSFLYSPLLEPSLRPLMITTDGFVGFPILFDLLLSSLIAAICYLVLHKLWSQFLDISGRKVVILCGTTIIGSLATVTSLNIVLLIISALVS